MFTYPVAASRTSLGRFSLCAAFAVMLGCQAGVKPTPTGKGGTGGSSTPGTAGTSAVGTGGSGTAGTAPPLGGFGGIVTNPDSGMGCQHTQYTFEPKIPTVYLVVDRSGSMFHCLSTSELVCSNKADTSWSKLKDAIETVLTQLDAQVRFGFTTIFGTNPAGGGSCPLMTAGTLADNVAPALNNAAAIKTLYDGLAWPSANDASNTGKKFESPASYAITSAAKALKADTTVGDKYIIFITDGQEDYCDDALEICASDSTVGALQTAFTASNIKTIVFGLQTMQFNLPGAVLDAFANAGAGEPTVAAVSSGLDATAIFDQCQGVSPWKADLTASGHPTTRGPTAVVGTYMATAGPTKPFKPDASDQTMLATQLSSALSGVKSCTFDLTATGGMPIKVDLNQLNKATIKVQGNTVPLDSSSANGWNMINQTTVELFGSACDAWRDPNAKTIDFNFPCEIIVD